MATVGRITGSRKFTPAQAAAAVARFERNWPATVIKGFHNGLKIAHRYAISKQMTGGGKYAPTLKDKLRIRSGNLRRTIAIIPPRRRNSGTFEGGLKAGSGSVLYARIHEKGGTIRARGAFLVFKIIAGYSSGKGPWVRVRQVRIPERSYLEPALIKNESKVVREINKAMIDSIQRILG